MIKLALAFILLTAGFILDCVAVHFLLIKNFDFSVVFLFLFHGISAVFVSLSLYILLSKKYGKSIYNFLVFFFLNFFLLLVGYLASLLFYIYLTKIYKARTIEPITLDSKEKMPVVKTMPNKQCGEGSICTWLNDSDASDNLKKGSLLYLIDIKSPLSYEYSKKGLVSFSDEIRLISFGFLSKTENEINKNINRLKKSLEAEGDEKNLAKEYYELSRLYWESVYLNIADKEFSDNNLRYAEEYAEKAVKDKYYYFDSLFILGRINLKLGNMDKAIVFFEEALFSKNLYKKVLPYLAEAFFIKKDFKRTKELLNKTSKYLIYNEFKNIVDLWTV